MSAPEIRPAPVRKSVVVKRGVAHAFTAFTKDIGRWWPRSHSVGSSPQADVIVEERAGGRWYERGTDGSECEWGKVLLWEPPTRLILAWQLNANWKYDPTLLTEVELTFTALAGGGTRVDLEHRNLERFGEHAAQIRDAIGSDRGWQGILDSYASHADALAPENLS